MLSCGHNDGRASRIGRQASHASDPVPHKFGLLMLGLVITACSAAAQVKEFVVFDRRAPAATNSSYVSFLGDYGLSRPRYEALDDTSKQDLGRLLTHLRERSVTVVNFEFLMPASDEFSLRFLADNHVAAAILANNHAGDHGNAMLIENAESLRKNGIAPVGLKQYPSWRWTGQGQSFLLAAQTEALDKPCDIVNRATDKSLGVKGNENDGATNILIVVVHDAAPSLYITDYEDRVARSYCNRGARLVVVMGSHEMKGAREYPNALAVFAPGNFLLNWRDGDEYLSVAPIVGFAGGKIVYFAVIPFYDEAGKKFRLLDDRAGAEAFRKYQDRSAGGAGVAYRDQSMKRDVLSAMRSVVRDGTWRRIRAKHVWMLFAFVWANYLRQILVGSVVCGLAVMAWRKRRARKAAFGNSGKVTRDAVLSACGRADAEPAGARTNRT